MARKGRTHKQAKKTKDKEAMRFILRDSKQNKAVCCKDCERARASVRVRKQRPRKYGECGDNVERVQTPSKRVELLGAKEKAKICVVPSRARVWFVCEVCFALFDWLWCGVFCACGGGNLLLPTKQKPERPREEREKREKPQPDNKATQSKESCCWLRCGACAVCRPKAV